MRLRCAFENGVGEVLLCIVETDNFLFDGVGGDKVIDGNIYYFILK